jgi:hypothetical protein
LWLVGPHPETILLQKQLPALLRHVARVAPERRAAVSETIAVDIVSLANLGAKLHLCLVVRTYRKKKKRLGAHLWDPLERDATEHIVQAAITSAKSAISVLGVGISAILEKVVPALESTITARRAIQNDCACDDGFFWSASQLSN